VHIIFLKEMTLIFLVRHGETPLCHTTDKTIDKNVPLSEKGRAQIEAICPKIPRNCAVIYTSPTIRTKETANIIQNTSCPHAIIVTDARLLNKADQQAQYDTNIRSFLSEILSGSENVVVVTHGRIVKMIYSIVKFGIIDIEIMDNLKIEYGDSFKIVSDHGKLLFNYQKL
jgi:broad specificity phosphatase PhoE